MLLNVFDVEVEIGVPVHVLELQFLLLRQIHLVTLQYRAAILTLLRQMGIVIPLLV